MSSSSNQKVAQSFGTSLDQDEFEHTKTLLSDDCRYDIGDEVLIGPNAICDSYEENMLAGREKLDVLEWGQSRIETLGEAEFHVHFTDYLTHKGKSYTHRCKQRLEFNDGGKISAITHIHDAEEQARLDAYYRSVGLKD